MKYRILKKRIKQDNFKVWDNSFTKGMTKKERALWWNTLDKRLANLYKEMDNWGFRREVLCQMPIKINRPFVFRMNTEL